MKRTDRMNTHIERGVMMSQQSFLVLKAWRVPGELLPSVCLESWRSHINRVDGLASKSEGEQAKAKFPCFISLYLGCLQKVPPRFKVALPASNSLMKKISHRSAQKLGVQLIPYAVKLTTKINHHKNGGHAYLAEFLTVWTLERMAIMGYSIQN